MKKITLLLAIFIAFQSNMIAQFTSIPDANFEQALVDFNIDSDNTVNGQILTADAAAVTGTLAIINRSVADFTGVEAFTAIDGLNISYNPVVSLDLTSNTNLTYLNAEGCTSLTSLDITGITTFTDVDLPGCPISTLDLSSNASLASLDVRLTGLTVLDLSSNGALVDLQCNNNGLTSLDMRNGNNANVTSFNSDFNGSLMCIFVDDASAAYLATWSKDASSTYVNDEAECNLLTVEGEDVVAFNMYPNPVKYNTVYITSNVEKATLSVYDITGKMVMNTALQFGENTINVNAIASGVYLARLSSNGKTLTKKLIIN